jgi:hypothetical protein
MNTNKENIESKKYSATPSTLYSFWKDLSGHSVRFAEISPKLCIPVKYSI